MNDYSVLNCEKNEITPRTMYQAAEAEYLRWRGLGECVLLVRWLTADTYVVIPVSQPEAVTRWD